MRSFSFVSRAICALLLASGAAPAHAQICGNGEYEPFSRPTAEGCDDGGLANGDGCSSTCQVEDGYYCQNPPTLETIDFETYPGGASTPNWSTNGFEATQSSNSDATIGLFGGQATEINYGIEIGVNTSSDNDFMGVVLGFNRGDSTNRNADFLLLDWKQDAQDGASRGLRLSRVRGVPSQSNNNSHRTDFWRHEGAVTELASGRTLGNTGWSDPSGGRTVFHRFDITFSPARVVVSVDGVEQFNRAAPVNDPFSPGEVGFYGFSLANVTYRIVDRAPSDCDLDADDDQIFNRDDADTDADGIPDLAEMPGFLSDPDGDLNGNGVPDWNDPATNTCVPAVTVPPTCAVLPEAQDPDGDGIPNHLDLDADGDGLLDVLESGNVAIANLDGTLRDDRDRDRDGLVDVVDSAPNDPSIATANFTPPNTDGAGRPDYLDLDSDGDNVSDLIESHDTDGNQNLSGEASPVNNDHDQDGVDDAYDVNCLGVGRPMGCQVAGVVVTPPYGPAEDSDQNGRPDWLQVCNDAYVSTGEVCDDGNNDNTDGCTTMCVRSVGEPCVLGTECGTMICQIGTNQCAPCSDTQGNGGIDQGCTAVTPACVGDTPESSFCAQCDDDMAGALVDDGCSAAQPSCDPSSNTCGTCVDSSVGGQDDGCTTDAPVCDGTRCVACEDSNLGGTTSDVDFGCGSGAPFCNTAGGAPRCDECFAASQCDDGNECTADSCSAAGTCVRASAAPQTQCGSGDVCDGMGTCVDCVDGAAVGTDPGCQGDAPLCNAAALGQAGMCVECLVDDDCATAETCGPNNTCVTGCNDDDDCPGSEVCDVGSQTCAVCIDDSATGTDAGCSAASPFCRGASGPGTPGTLCGGCDDDSECPGAVCDARTETCQVCVDDAPAAVVDRGCEGMLPVCDETGRRRGCVECETDDQCQTGLFCGPDKMCGVGDTDGDGYTDDIDLDDDGDGIRDDVEGGGVDPSGDEDGDTIPDFLDPDTTDCLDADDNGLCERPAAVLDFDGDGVANHIDLDSDGDGVPDSREGHDMNRDGVPDTFPSGRDANMNGVDAAFDVEESGTAAPTPDADGDSRPDYLDVDSDDDALTDRVEVFDLDGDGTADRAPLGVDANRNGIDDAYDGDMGGTPADVLDSDGDGLVDALDVDSDGDGARDDVECPNPSACVDFDGDGVADHRDLDSDGDGIVDAIEYVDADADGVADIVASGTDANRDGQDDAFPRREPGPDRDQDGARDRDDLDDDGDGVATVFECPDPSQPCPDADGDGTPDYLDPAVTPRDTDMDGIPDLVECGGDLANCVDTDGDGDPDHMDGDDDDDGIPTRTECAGGPAACDRDQDGRPNHLDLDADGDGILDSVECEDGGNCADVDRDGAPDYLDLDTDDDGIVDAIEGHDADHDGAPDRLPLGADSNGNGLDDAYDPAAGGRTATVPDTDGDGTRDWRDADDDGDGLATSFECPNTAACSDGNRDGRPDYLDRDAAALDTDGDGIPDAVECPEPTSVFQRTLCRDSDGDGRPDFNDPDDDNDGILTRDESYDGDLDPTDDDTDRDGRPDYLDPDDDNDTLPTLMECPNFNIGCPDTDGDGRPDYLDVCGDGTRSAFDGVSTYEECDDGNLLDGDGCSMSCRVEGEFTEGDRDMDGLLDTRECPPPGNILDPSTCPDFDMDGRPDFDDPDDDNDGVLTRDELGDGGPANPRDTDMDGNLDYLDVDDDNDTIPTSEELGDGGGAAPRDTDMDGLFDFIDPDDDNDSIPTATERRDGDALTPPNDDVDMDGFPNWRDTDADGDGIPDADEPDDADMDGTPDYLQPSRGPGVSGGALCSASAGRGASSLAWLLLAAAGLIWRRRSRR